MRDMQALSQDISSPFKAAKNVDSAGQERPENKGEDRGFHAIMDDSGEQANDDAPVDAMVSPQGDSLPEGLVHWQAAGDQDDRRTTADGLAFSQLRSVTETVDRQTDAPSGELENAKSDGLETTSSVMQSMGDDALIAPEERSHAVFDTGEVVIKSARQNHEITSSDVNADGDQVLLAEALPKEFIETKPHDAPVDMAAVGLGTVLSPDAMGAAMLADDVTLNRPAGNGPELKSPSTHLTSQGVISEHPAATTTTVPLIPDAVSTEDALIASEDPSIPKPGLELTSNASGPADSAKAGASAAPSSLQATALMAARGGEPETPKHKVRMAADEPVAEGADQTDSKPVQTELRSAINTPVTSVSQPQYAIVETNRMSTDAGVPDRTGDALLPVASIDAAMNAEHQSTVVRATRPDVAQHVAQQLALALHRAPDRPVEVALNPEELGRVSMMLSQQDGALTLAVQAERPETLELLRRNIDQLAYELNDLGYQNLSFSFSGDANQRDSDGANGGTVAEQTGSIEEMDELPSPIRMTLGATDRLDLRL